MARQPRGLTDRDERFHSHVIRDTRTLSVRISDSLKNPRHVSLALLGIIPLLFFSRFLSDIIFLLGLFSFIYCYTRKAKLPFRMPEHSGLLDPNDPIPGSTTKFKKAEGIYHFGNDPARHNEELWLSNDDMRTHVLIFGSTGSGKTVALIGMAYNALLQASGFIYVDGKGDNSLFAHLFSVVRYMGREDDLLLINFMTGARDVIGRQEKRLSNTLNPFAVGSSSMLAQLVVGLMGKSGNDGDMWKNRAIGFVEALMRVLVTMRDAGYLLLDAHSIREYFLLDRLETMVMDKLFIRTGQEPINLDGLPAGILEPLNSYVFNLPGYNKERKGKQVSQVLEQHGYITMQLTRAFTSLADTYGHIMRTPLAEVDLKDVVLNRRVMCVLLPALEKSPDELANLGKVIISSLKAMMASGLGDHVEGSYQDLIDSKPTNALTPFLCILDEYGYYAVEGFAVVPAQARSLGFSVVFAGQDLPAFQKASKEEAASIGANTNIKICMKLEDPTDTWDFFMKSAGESYVTHVDNFQVDQGSVMGTYQDAKGARVEKRQRIDLLDLKEQRPGEAHFFFKSKIIRGRFFYANPPAVPAMRLNHFLKVHSPLDRTVSDFLSGFETFNTMIENGVSFDAATTVDEEIETLIERVDQDNFQQFPFYTISQLVNVNQAELDFSDFFSDLDMDDSLAHVSLFSSLEANSVLESLIISDQYSAFKQPLLDRVDVKEQIEYVQRLCKSTGSKASSISLELLSDLEKGTRYPSEGLSNGLGSVEHLVAIIDELVTAIDISKQE